MTATRLQRGALIALVVSTGAIAAAYASAFRPGGAPHWASWALALGLATCMTSITVLGVASGVRARSGGAPLMIVLASLAAVWALMAVCFGLALVLPPESAAEPRLWLGLPRRSAILIYGIGVLPLLVLPFAYAFTFDALTLPPEELERIRAAAKQARDMAPRQEAA
jgi:hypothetical protein